ncbi:MAG: coproporphyrinogen dehydrogenase HemZ [Clostridia bacterium]|nr:coproporphyrinogen dehydrogenase HemZ [Clostridia bacterium]
MKLILNGRINRTYVQTLCMMFFRGEKFPENEENSSRILTVTTIDTDDGINCECELCVNNKTVRESSFVPFSQSEKYERSSKSAVGIAVYNAGVKLTGRNIPWGILTGIRPSKVAYELLSKNTEENAKLILQNRYLLSENKANLAIRVAKNEGEILKISDNNTCSLYISIPFCPSRCSYCSFISYATPKLFELIPSYIDKLVKEITSTLESIKNQGLKLLSIYIGGGTPTVLSEGQLEEILKAIHNSIDVDELIEFTLEGGRPDTITDKKLEIAKKYGVNRISVNPQTLNDDVLKAIGRHHTVNDFFEAYERVQNSGINFINTDLIAGLENDSFDSFKNTIDKIIALAPDNITVHSFSVKKSAQILRDNAEIYGNEADYAVKSVDYAYKALTENGYEPYYMYRQKNTVCDLENVGYAKKGTFGIYNVLMMSDCHTVFGVGAGATTKIVKNIDGNLEIKRIFSHKYPYEYLQDN